MPALSKPTNGVNTDYSNKIGLLFDAFNNGNYNFPSTQVPSADANTLDDYEEGTWTPAVQFGGAAVGITYSAQGASYTKTGDRASYSGVTVLSSKGSSSGSMTIAGLPFASRNANNGYSATCISLDATSFTGHYSAVILINQTSITLYQTSEAGTRTALANTNATNTSSIIFSGEYPV